MASHILLYHGVTSSKSFGIENYSKKHINIKLFEKQMKFLKKNRTVVPLRKIRQIKNSVAITFDDTFKNVYTNALPILKKYSLPATFFITTGFVGSSKNFWVDKLEMYVNFCTKKELNYNFYLIKKKLNLKNKKNKIKSVNFIKSHLKTLDPKRRNYILSQIKIKLSPKILKKAENYKNLNWSEIKKLHCPPNYEVGGHTVNHEILSYLDKKNMEYEIFESLKQLRKNIKKKIDLFSYPEGQKKHYNKKVIKCLKKNKVIMCPSAIYGVVTKRDDNFNLKRQMVGFNNLPFPVKKI